MFLIRECQIAGEFESFWLYLVLCQRVCFGPCTILLHVGILHQFGMAAMDGWLKISGCNTGWCSFSEYLTPAMAVSMFKTFGRNSNYVWSCCSIFFLFFLQRPGDTHLFRRKKLLLHCFTRDAEKMKLQRLEHEGSLHPGIVFLFFGVFVGSFSSFCSWRAMVSMFCTVQYFFN